MNPALLSWMPVRLDDLESAEGSVYRVKVSLPDAPSGNSLISTFSQEVHQVKLGFNRFFGTVERQWLSSESCKSGDR
jgi:hypothetical protein